MNGFPPKFGNGMLAAADGRGGWSPVCALRLLTGSATLAAGALLYGAGTSTLSTLAPGTGLLMLNGAGAPTITTAPTLDSVTATGVSGLLLKNSSGTTVATIGAGPGAAVTLAGALAVTGAVTGVTTLAVSGLSTFSDILTVQKNANALIYANIANTTTGTAAGAFQVFQTDVGTSYFGCGSSTFTTLAGAAGKMLIYDAGGLQVSVPHMILGTDPGGSELLRVGGAGSFSSYVRADVAGNGVGTYALRAANAGSGTGTGGGISLGYNSFNGTFAGIVGRYEAPGVSLSLRVAVDNSAVEPTEVAKFDGSSTAGHTRFLIYDVDNGTLERVTVGAADSGGAGFKLLRIPN